MAGEEAKKVAPEASSETVEVPSPEPPVESPKDVAPSPEPPVESSKDVAEEKAIIAPPAEEKPNDCKALAIVVERLFLAAWQDLCCWLKTSCQNLKIHIHETEFYVKKELKHSLEATDVKKPEEGSINRDAVLARVATEKRISLIKAWEESEKSKAENKAHKKISSIAAWENCKKATLEAELKKIEEKLEIKKAEYIEKTKNKVVLVHKTAEEKRAMVEAKREEDLLKAEEIAAKYRATGTAPKKLLGIF